MIFPFNRRWLAQIISIIGCYFIVIKFDDYNKISAFVACIIFTILVHEIYDWLNRSL